MGIPSLNSATLYRFRFTFQLTFLADLTKNAGLTGSQALVNITVKESVSTILGIYTKYIINAEGTVVEFTE